MQNYGEIGNIDCAENYNGLVNKSRIERDVDARS